MRAIFIPTSRNTSGVGSRKRCLRRKLFIYLWTVPLFSATIPWLLQQHQVDLKLSRVSEASVGVQIRHSDMAAGSHEESYQDLNRKLYWKYILNFPFYSLFSELHLHLNNCLNFLISFRGVFVWSSSNALCFSNFWKYSLFLSRFAFSCSRFFCFLKIE